MVTEAASGSGLAEGGGGVLMLSGFCYYSDIYVFIIILYHIFVIVLQSVLLSWS